MKSTLIVLAGLLSGVLALTRPGLIAPLFSGAYLPHRFCYLAKPGLIWTNAITDALIALSYAVIFGALGWITLRLRRLEGFGGYLWITVSFASFIVACGATHFMEVVTIWWPVYPFSAAVKVLCAAVSIPTAILIALRVPVIGRAIPKLFELLSTTQTERDQARAEVLAAALVLEEQKRADALIADANATLNDIMDSTSERVVKISRDWQVVYANRKALVTMPNQLHESFWDINPTLRGTSIEILLRRAMQERIETTYEAWYEPHDRWYRVNVYPTPRGISLFSTDISEHKRLERVLEIERSEALSQIHSVMESTSDGILKMNPDWTIRYANGRARAMLPDLVLGADFWACFPKAEPENVRQLHRCMIEQSEGEWENFYEPYNTWFSTHCFAADGGLSLFFSNITVRKELEQQLERERTLREKRVEALSNMAGGLAHEISNPLAIIEGLASDLDHQAASGLADLPEVRRVAREITRTSERASRILRGLRGFAREADRDPMEYASIACIVDECAELQEMRFERHHLELTIAVETALPPVLCRETQIGQIVTNLLNNAMDAIVEKNCLERWVRIECTRAGDSICIDVVDSGLGIDEEARARLMEPFFTTKTRGLGMGVGLSLSRAIADAHGGSLVLLKGPAHTTFRLLLPLEQPVTALPEIELAASVLVTP